MPITNSLNAQERLVRLRSSADSLNQSLTTLYQAIATEGDRLQNDFNSIQHELLVNAFLFTSLVRYGHHLFLKLGFTREECHLSVVALVYLSILYWNVKALNYGYNRQKEFRNGVKSPTPQANFVELVKNIESSYTYIAVGREHQKLKYFHNRETFVWNTPVNQIDSSYRITLDGYAFDIRELISYAENTPHKILRNPHVLGNENHDFSDQAIDRMKNLPLLRTHIEKTQEEFRNQIHNITPATVDAVIVMLQKLHEAGEKNSAEARALFSTHRDKLSKIKKQHLDNYLIKVPYVRGGFQILKLNDVLLSDCAHTFQIYLWQFVIDLRPEAKNLIPETVHALASNASLEIKNMESSIEERQGLFFSEIDIDMGFTNTVAGRTFAARTTSILRSFSLFAIPVPQREEDPAASMRLNPFNNDFF